MQEAVQATTVAASDTETVASSSQADARKNPPSFRNTLFYFGVVSAAWLLLGILIGGDCLIAIILGHKHLRRREKIALGIMAAMQFFGLLLFGGLGSWCRSFTDTADCGEGVEQSRDCLLNKQTDPYRTAYIIHFVGAGFAILRWAICIVQVPATARALANQTSEIPFLFTPAPLASWEQAGMWLIMTTLVSLTWIFFIDWSSDDFGSLATLFGAIFGEAIACCLIMGGIAYLRSRWRKRNGGNSEIHKS